MSGPRVRGLADPLADWIAQEIANAINNNEAKLTQARQLHKANEVHSNSSVFPRHFRAFELLCNECLDELEELDPIYSKGRYWGAYAYWNLVIPFVYYEDP